MTKRAAGLLALAGGGLVLAVLLWREIPTWRPGGSLMILHEPLEEVGTTPIVVPEGGKIVVFGDSNSRGERGAPQSAYPAIVERALGRNTQVTNRSRGGFTAEDALERWQVPPGTDLCIIAMGTNDAAPRAQLQRKQRVPIEEYKSHLHALAERCANVGARTLFLAPFGTGTHAMNSRIEPYRQASRQVAIERGANFLDPISAFMGTGDDSPLLFADALHLNRRAQTMLGEWLARKLSVEAEPAA